MKKIFNLLICMVVAAFAASCSDDTDNPYATSSTVTVTDAQLFFGATASDSGRIAFTAQGPVTATTDASWAKAEVKGDTVYVSVEQNTSRYTRSASVKLTCQGSTTSLALVQKGINLNLSQSYLSENTDAAVSDTINLESNVEFVVESKPDWVNVRIANGKVIVDFDANTTGSFRRGKVYIKSDQFRDSIVVNQYKFDRDVKGSYKLTYYTDTTYTTTRTVNAIVKDSTITLQGMVNNVPYTFDESTMSIVFTSGDYAGNDGSNFLYLILADETVMYWSAFYSGFKISASLDFDANGNVEAPFLANNSGRIYSTILFARFSSQSFAQDNFTGSYKVRLFRPVLTRTVAK